MEIKNIILMTIIIWLWVFSLPILMLLSFLSIIPAIIILFTSGCISFAIQCYNYDNIITTSIFRTKANNINWLSWFKSLHVHNKPANNTNYLIISQPHGVLCCGILTGVHFRPNSKTVFAVAPVLFYIPILGWILRELGCIPAEKRLIKKALTMTSVILAIDGVPGIVAIENNTLYIDKRFGAFKIALETNTSIIPTWTTNEYKTYSLLSLPFVEFRKELSNRLGIAIIFPYIFGWKGTWLPKPVDLIVTLGTPIEPGSMSVTVLKREYLNALRRLYSQST